MGWGRISVDASALRARTDLVKLPLTEAFDDATLPRSLVAHTQYLDTLGLLRHGAKSRRNDKPPFWLTFGASSGRARKSDTYPNCLSADRSCKPGRTRAPSLNMRRLPSMMSKEAYRGQASKRPEILSQVTQTAGLAAFIGGFAFSGLQEPASDAPTIKLVLYVITCFSGANVFCARTI